MYCNSLSGVRYNKLSRMHCKKSYLECTVTKDERLNSLLADTLFLLYECGIKTMTFPDWPACGTSITSQSYTIRQNTHTL